MFKNLSPGSIIYRNGKAPVDLTSLPTEKTCKTLYLQGFRHIGITEKSLSWLKQCPVLKLEELIALKTTEKKAEELEILQQALNAKKRRTKK